MEPGPGLSSALLAGSRFPSQPGLRLCRNRAGDGEEEGKGRSEDPCSAWWVRGPPRLGSPARTPALCCAGSALNPKSGRESVLSHSRSRSHSYSSSRTQVVSGWGLLFGPGLAGSASSGLLAGKLCPAQPRPQSGLPSPAPEDQSET